MRLGEIDVSSELELGGHTVPKPFRHSSWNSQPTWSLMFWSKRYALLSPGRKHDSATMGIVLSTWEGHREAVPDTAWPWTRAFVGTVWVGGLYSQMMSHTLATWSNEQFVNVRKWVMSPNHSSLFFGEICLRPSKIYQVGMLSFAAFNMPSIGNLNRQKNLLEWGQCKGRQKMAQSTGQVWPWVIAKLEWFLHF